MTTTEERPDVVADDEPGAAARPRRRSGTVRRLAMRPRRVLVRVHRWVAIALAVWLAVISLTGLWLVFNQGLDARLHADRYDHTSGDVGAARALTSANAALPKEGSTYYLTFPTNGRGVYQAHFSVPIAGGAPDAERYGTVFVDPGTGHVNGRRWGDEGFTAWMYRGHMYLWQDRGVFAVFDPQHGWCRATKGVEPGGVKGVVCDVIPDGEDMVAWFGVGWLVVLLTGFYLWYWPGVRRWATAFAVKRGRGRFATQMSLHKAVGLAVFVPLTVIAFTGISFAFPNLKGWFENATPAARGAELWTPPERAVSKPIKGATPLDADAAVRTIRTRFPERRLDGIEMPADETGTWNAWVDRGFSPWTREAGAGNVYVVLDQYTGRVLYDGKPAEGNVLDQAWDDWIYPLHTGDFGGTTTRSIWLVIALSPIALGATGLTMGQIRRTKRRRREVVIDVR